MQSKISLAWMITNGASGHDYKVWFTKMWRVFFLKKWYIYEYQLIPDNESFFGMAIVVQNDSLLKVGSMMMG